MDFIYAAELKKQFTCYGHFYELELMTGELLKCRSVLEIVDTTIAQEDPSSISEREPDVVVIADEHGYPFMDTVDRTLTLLYRKLDRGGSVALLLPNPDLVYPAGPDTYGFTSGALARMFEAALGFRYPQRSDLAFVPLGKPHGPIFQEALRRSNTRSMVMVGDQLETDIRGAVDFGLDMALVGTGLSRPMDPDGTQACRPTYYLASLEVTG